MESGSAVVGREERKKYHVYVEEYVLSYLRRESDSLELSEIYFYGSRQEDGRKLYVYGAGRAKGIAAFAEYELLSELVCRLTQAGPVFLVRESDGECRPSGFQIFYDNNEAMQNYLLEWTGSTGKARAVERDGGQEKLPAPTVFPEEEKKRTPHGAMSVQLCLILVVLVAIVITSTDSYDKMEELNRSAKEVFFAIENQEAEETSKEAGEQEIVVERDTREAALDSGDVEKPAENADFDGTADGLAQGTDSDAPDSDTEGSAEKEQQEEGVLKPAQEPSSETEGQDPTEEKDENPQGGTAPADEGEEKKEDKKEASEQSEEDNEEALSRSITRYYEVEQGDTLYTISQKIYGDISRVDKICEVNDISDPDKIRSGQRIILP